MRKKRLYLALTRRNKMKKIFKFIYILATVLLTAYLSSIFSRYGTNGWYQTLPQPAITPPDYVFPIAWTVLYALLIWASYSALNRTDSLVHSRANDLFIAQCFLQILWCFVFFAHGQLAWGLGIIILLDIAVLKMTHLYYKLNHWAAYILAPYCLWMLFATILNIAYVWMHGISAKI